MAEYIRWVDVGDENTVVIARVLSYEPVPFITRSISTLLKGGSMEGKERRKTG